MKIILKSRKNVYEATGDYNLLKTNRKISEDPNHVEDEIYVINTTTHQIYFPHGIVVDNIMYYTF